MKLQGENPGRKGQLAIATEVCLNIVHCLVMWVCHTVLAWEIG